MKQTPLQKAIAEIEGYKPIAGTDPFPYIIAKLQSLLPYEMECIEGAHVDGTTHNHDCEVAGKPKMSAHDYFTNTFKTNPQGGGEL